VAVTLTPSHDSPAKAFLWLMVPSDDAYDLRGLAEAIALPFVARLRLVTKSGDADVQPMGTFRAFRQRVRALTTSPPKPDAPPELGPAAVVSEGLYGGVELGTAIALFALTGPTPVEPFERVVLEILSGVVRRSVTAGRPPSAPSPTSAPPANPAGAPMNPAGASPTSAAPMNPATAPAGGPTGLQGYFLCGSTHVDATGARSPQWRYHGFFPDGTYTDDVPTAGWPDAELPATRWPGIRRGSYRATARGYVARAAHGRVIELTFHLRQQAADINGVRCPRIDGRYEGLRLVGPYETSTLETLWSRGSLLTTATVERLELYPSGTFDSRRVTTPLSTPGGPAAPEARPGEPARSGTWKVEGGALRLTYDDGERRVETFYVPSGLQASAATPPESFFLGKRWYRRAP
jgi:hypothetical protein